MNRWLWRSGSILCTIGLLLPTLASTPASAKPADPAAIRAAATSAAAQQRVARYWTPERMRAATSLDLIVAPATGPQHGGTQNGSAQNSNPVAAGRPTTISPTAAAGSTATDTTVSPQSLPNGGAQWTGGGAVTRTGGRVFFTINGQNASCSGNAVTSTNRSVVITAGHCVKYQGSWHTNWAFVPGYANGARPFGTWTARATLTTPQWEASEDLNFDIGAAVVNPLDGRSLTDVVGAQGVAFNQPRRQPMYSFGYPAAAPYDGSKLTYCSGNTIDDFLLSKDLGLTCNMTGGSSGGPWFLSFNEATGTGVQASVNSFKYNFLPWMFGPYFGTDAQNLYNAAQAR